MIHYGRAWTRAEKWLPCAIGSLPSVSDPNGRLPTCATYHEQSVKLAAASAAASASPQFQPSPMEFAVQSAQPVGLNQKAEGAKMPDTSRLESEQQEQQLLTSENGFADYWQRFDIELVASVPQEHLDQLMLQSQTIKVL